MRPPKNRRNKRLVELKDKGLSYRELGRLFDVSAKTAHRIYQRHNTYRDIVKQRKRGAEWEIIAQEFDMTEQEVKKYYRRYKHLWEV